jgi:hypothetical protein
VRHTATVYDRIRPHTIIYNRIRQSYSSVYGVETVTFKSLRIFIRSPYTISVSHRFIPYTVPAHGSCVRPPYVSVFHRKRSFTTMHVRPGYILRMKIDDRFKCSLFREKFMRINTVCKLYCSPIQKAWHLSYDNHCAINITGLIDIFAVGRSRGKQLISDNGII